MPLLGVCASDLSSSSSVIMAPSTRLLPTWPAPLSAKARVELPWRTIRMGGGPRTYPGGVSKWEWKRMQAKKAKQLLKARLCRERQIYEMRRRAEMRAAVAELELPWEAVETAPALFSVRADEQVKVLADRFNRPGGCDLWTEQDGPQLFFRDNRGNPSARFFPGGAVHSVKPYEVTGGGGSEVGERPARSSSRMSRRRRNGGRAEVDIGEELLKQDVRKAERDHQKATSLSDSEMSYNARRRRRDIGGGRDGRLLSTSVGGLKSSFNGGRGESRGPGRHQSDSKATSLSDSEMSYNARRRRRDIGGGRDGRLLSTSVGGLKSSFNGGRGESRGSGRHQSDSKATSLSDSEMSYNARRRRRDIGGGRDGRLLSTSGGGLKSSFNRGRGESREPGRHQSDSELLGFGGRHGREEDDF